MTTQELRGVLRRQLRTKIIVQGASRFRFDVVRRSAAGCAFTRGREVAHPIRPRKFGG